MNTIYSKIGDHFFKMDVHSDYFLEVINQSFDILATIPSKVDCTLTIKQGYGQKFVDYDVDIIKDETGTTYKRADYYIHFNKDYTEGVIDAYSRIGLKHAFLNAYSTFIMEKNWGLLLHSSCVIENGKAHIFVGPSEAGKSTAARLSSPRSLLSDEATILKVTDNGAFTMYSPFRSDNFTKPTKEVMEKEWPIGAIQVIRQSPENKQTPLRKSDAFVEMYPQVFYWCFDGPDYARALSLLHKMLQQVPTYELFFRKDPSFWEVVAI